jgi:hypothetical protein
MKRRTLLFYCVILTLLCGCHFPKYEKNKVEIEIVDGFETDNLEICICVEGNGELTDVDYHKYTKASLKEIFIRDDKLFPNGELELYIVVPEGAYVIGEDLLETIDIIYDYANNSERPWKKVKIVFTTG